MSWWGIALIVIGAAGAGVGGTVVFVVLKKKKELMIIQGLIRLIMRTFQVQSICSEELP